MYVQQALLNFSFVCELLEIFQNLHSASNIQFIWKGKANSAFSRKHNQAILRENRSSYTSQGILL